MAFVLASLWLFVAWSDRAVEDIPLETKARIPYRCIFSCFAKVLAPDGRDGLPEKREIELRRMMLEWSIASC